MNGFSLDSVVRNPPTSGGDAGGSGWMAEWGRFSGEENGNLIQYSYLEKSHGPRSLSDYTVHGVAIESDTTERLTKHRCCD